MSIQGNRSSNAQRREPSGAGLRILIFTEGTILTYREHAGLPRERVVELVKGNDAPLTAEYFAHSVPIGDCVRKIEAWKRQGATIAYLTSRTTRKEVEIVKGVLARYHFPDGELFFRNQGERYADVAARALPDVLVEDDCESIGEEEVTYPQIKPELRARIKSVIVKEFGGIDHLPDNVSELLNLR